MSRGHTYGKPLSNILVFQSAQISPSLRRAHFPCSNLWPCFLQPIARDPLYLPYVMPSLSTTFSSLGPCPCLHPTSPLGTHIPRVGAALTPQCSPPRQPAASPVDRCSWQVTELCGLLITGVINYPCSFHTYKH